MIIYVRTENSLYVLDTDAKTWERLETHVATEPRECKCVGAYSEETEIRPSLFCDKCAGYGMVHVAVETPAPLRTVKGKYRERTEPILIGAPLTLICDPLDPKMDFRIITTSPVIGTSYEAR